MKKKGLFNKIVAGVLSLSILIMPTAHAIQAEDDIVFAYGAGLSQHDITMTREMFEIVETNTKDIKVTGADAMKYLGFSRSSDKAQISSALIKKNNNQGVNVQVVTPDKITKVSEATYKNVAITAGLHNYDIYIGSVKTVTGEAALTGVYKSAETLYGESVDEDKIKQGQDEMKAINEILEDSDVDDETINITVAEIKKDIAKEAKKDGIENVSEQTINNIINNNINKINIQLSDENKAKMVDIGNGFKDSLKDVDVDDVISNLNNFGKDFTDKIVGILDDANESGFFTKIWNAIKDFFNKVFQSIKDIFVRDNTPSNDTNNNNEDVNEDIEDTPADINASLQKQILTV